MSTRKKLQSLEKRRARLVEQLLKDQLMLRGNFSSAYRRCGKPTCWCVEGKGHIYYRVTWSEEGISRTKCIPENDSDWIRMVTENYQTFRKNRQKVRQINEEIRILLDELEKALVNKTRKLRDYLKLT